MNKMRNKRLLAVALGSLLLAGTAQAALEDRGGGMIYDTELDITWLQNWNQGAGSGYDDKYGLGGTGQMTWLNAKAWASTLEFGGFSNWRLPTTGPVNGSTFQYGWSTDGSTDFGYAKTGTGWGTANEMGHLYYVTLGNKGYCTPENPAPATCTVQPGWGMGNSGPFQNIQTDRWYWTGRAYNGSLAWVFTLDQGSSGFWMKDYDNVVSVQYAVAVRNGDVTAVPEPQTFALLLLGLTGLAVLRRQRTD